MTGSNDGLPDGWVITTLGDARLDLSKSIDPRKSGAEMFELYSVPSFSDRRPEIVPGNTVGSSKRTVETNAVLLCKINPRINRVWIVGDYSHHQKIASTEWLSFFQISELDPGYLCYCLQQHEFRNYLAANASGVGGSLMRVRGTTFADYPLPLPPLPEQHRIVAEIEKQFTRLDASVAALKRVQANLKRYRASVLKAACEGKLVPIEAELARTEGRDYEPADQLLERILSERRALLGGPGEARAQVQGACRTGHLRPAGVARRVGVDDAGLDLAKLNSLVSPSIGHLNDRRDLTRRPYLRSCQCYLAWTSDLYDLKRIGHL